MPSRKKSDAVAINLRMKESLRAKMARAAKKGGVSMNTEIVNRLSASLEPDTVNYEIFGGEANFRYMRLLGGIIHEVELITKALWTEDAHTKDKVIDLARAFFRRMGVEPLPDSPSGLFSFDSMMEHKAEEVLPEIIERWAAKFDLPNAPQKKKPTHPKPRKKARKVRAT